MNPMRIEHATKAVQTVSLLLSDLQELHRASTPMLLLLVLPEIQRHDRENPLALAMGRKAGI